MLDTNEVSHTLGFYEILDFGQLSHKINIDKYWVKICHKIFTNEILDFPIYKIIQFNTLIQ